MRFRETLREMTAAELRAAAAGLLRLLDGEAGMPPAVSGETMPDRAGRRVPAETEGAAERGTAAEAAAERSSAAREEITAPEARRRNGTPEHSARQSAAEKAAAEDGPRPRAAPDDLEDTTERRRLSETLEALSGANRRMLSAAEPNGTGPAAETGGAPLSMAAVSAARSYGSGDGPAGTAFPAGAAEGAAAQEHRPSGAHSVSGRSDMDAISEFFRRDSRRYDAGFGG